MNLNKKQQDLEKEIKELKELRFDAYNGNELLNENELLIQKQSELKGIKFAKEEILKEITALNQKFRKDNTTQRLSGDEFNDLWEEELREAIISLRGNK